MKYFRANHPIPFSVYHFFFHPDFTVGLGISPNHALRLVGFTTGGESHPALKNLIKLGLCYHAFQFLSTKKINIVYLRLFPDRVQRGPPCVKPGHAPDQSDRFHLFTPFSLIS